MCIIIDTCVMGDFLNQNCDYMAPIRNWINGGKGRIAFSQTERFRNEVRNFAQFLEYRRGGKVKMVDSSDVNSKEKSLIDKEILTSNDSHVIALALVGRITLLVTSDKKLITDFTNCVGKGQRKGKVIEKGRDYSQKKMNNLLSSARCP